MLRWLPRLAVPTVGFLLLLTYVRQSQADAAVVDGCIVFALIALSLNAVIGYIGQLSLGHQGFVGLGAATSAYAATQQGLPFFSTLLVGLVTGALAALLMGLVALRISGLYLSLVTLVFGLTMQSSAFSTDSLSGHGAGQQSDRPSFVQDSDQYFWLLLVVLVVVLYVDRQLTRSKAGRALATLKESERVAEAVGIDVTRFKLLAFTYSGALAGLAGSLFAYNTQQFSPKDFNFLLALTFVAMTVVGGPGSRAGVVAGGAFFAALTVILGPWFGSSSSIGTFIAGSDSVQVPAFLGAVLLIATLVFTPGGMAQVLDPVVRWVCGGPFELGHRGSGPGAVDGKRAVPEDKLVPAATPVLEVHGLSIRFGGLQALRGIDLHVGEHEIVGLIGPNGAGKTTAFNCITGFYRPNAGRVTYRGRDITKTPPHVKAAMGFGRTFQNVGLVKSTTVLENLKTAQHTRVPYSVATGMVGGPSARLAERELVRRADEVLDVLGLGEVRDRPVGDLSYGTLKLLELGCALATDPDVLLLDEPSSGMGPEEAHELGDRLLQLRRDLGLTMLLIEHHVPLVTRVCDYVYVLNFGGLLAEGTPDVVRNHPEVVYAYLGVEEEAAPPAIHDAVEAAAAKPVRKRPPARKSPAPKKRSAS